MKPRPCLICSDPIIDRSPKATTCGVVCFNEWRRQKRARAGSSIVGTSLICKECGAGFVKEHKRQFYCQSCAALSARDYLPSQRARVRAYQCARNKRRRSAIPAVALHERMSAGIKNSIAGGKSGRSWESLAGYTVADLLAHLERQFQPRMTWANRGEWHIDHIVPVSSFEFTTPDCPGFKAAWALSNLRPLWATENIRKSAKRTHLI